MGSKGLARSEEEGHDDFEADLVEALWPAVCTAMDLVKKAPNPAARIRAFAWAAGEMVCALAFREEKRDGQGEREWDQNAIFKAFEKGWDTVWAQNWLEGRNEVPKSSQAPGWGQHEIAALLEPRSIFARYGVQAEVLESLEDLARSRGDELAQVVAQLLNDTVTWRRGVVH